MWKNVSEIVFVKRLNDRNKQKHTLVLPTSTMTIMPPRLNKLREIEVVPIGRMNL